MDLSDLVGKKVIPVNVPLHEDLSCPGLKQYFVSESSSRRLYAHVVEHFNLFFSSSETRATNLYDFPPTSFRGQQSSPLI